MPNRSLTSHLIFLISISLNSVIAIAAPEVLSIAPPAQSMVSANDLEITVQFDSSVDPESIDEHSFAVFGRWTGVCPGTFQFENNDQIIRFLPTKTFSAGEWIAVVLSKKIRGSDGQEMSHGYAWNFWTASAPGSFDLSRKKTIMVRRDFEENIRTYGAYAGDLNGDGFHDFTVPNEDASDVRVFMNDGSGDYASFDIYSVPPNSAPSTNEGADFNGDGLLDFAVGNINAGTVTVFFGDGNGSLTNPHTYPTGAGTRGLAVLDLNSDGAPDIVTANRSDNNISILINKGDGTFANSIPMETGTEGETSCAAADANEDGIMDVLVGSFNSREIVVLLGDGNGNLTASSTTNARSVCWMIAAGDIDNDSHVDVVSANAQQAQFTALRGDGHGNLSSAEIYSTGVVPLAIDLGDIDGDGDLDVVTSNFASADFSIFENDGSGNFTNVKTLLASSAGSCAVLHDRDRDGDLDITGIDELDDLLFLFDNPGSPTNVTQPAPPVVSNFQLQPGYPNPFSRTAAGSQTQVTIPFILNEKMHVKLEVVNIKGQRVALLMDSDLQAGQHTVAFPPQYVPAGVYFCRLISGNVSFTRKLLLFP